MKIKIKVVNKSSSVKDNDLTKYRSSIKPSNFEYPYIKHERSSGESPKIGDVLLIKIQGKIYKLEIVKGQHGAFKDVPTLFNGRLYPVDREQKEILNKEAVVRSSFVYHCIIKFDQHFNREKDVFQIDYTKGGLYLNFNYFNRILGTSISTKRDDLTPFEVVKFLTRSIPESSVIKDSDDHDYDDISIGLDDLLHQYKLYGDFLEGIKNLIDKLASLDDSTSSDEISLEMQALNNLASSIEDTKYCIADLIDQLEKFK